jgi:hypothetical protein
MVNQPGMFQPSDQTPSPAYRIAPQDAGQPPIDVDALVYRQIMMMQAAGWTLERHWPGGADFVSRGTASVSFGMHLLLCLFTCGLWLPVMIIMEVARPNAKRCRLTIDENGQPQYTS